MTKSDLTPLLKSILGTEMVKEAYQITDGLTYDIERNTFTELTIEPQDGYAVVVELSNGKRFKIWSSEWGGISALR